MRRVSGGVTAAKGFVASGVSAGIKSNDRADCALILAEKSASAAAVFTTNRVTAAPVLLSKQHLRGGNCKAVIINSGNANCLNGAEGIHAARQTAAALAAKLNCDPKRVLVASTGIIARPLPVKKIIRAVPALIKSASRAGHQSAAEAILTTDTVIKEAALREDYGKRAVTIGGMAKGAGMLAPSMATMIAVITTDAKIAPALLRKLLQRAVRLSFNRISVDGDMSTNDTVFLLASGASDVAIKAGTRAESIFYKQLETVCLRLAAMLVEDGEGATKLMRVEVAGARSDRDAQRCARQVALSPLVKTMLSSGDPNVGRIAGAVGASGAVFDPNKLEISIGKTAVVTSGTACKLSPAALSRLLRPKQVNVLIHLHAGQGCGWMLTCDLTKEYVRINAEYAT